MKMKNNYTQLYYQCKKVNFEKEILKQKDF